MGFLSVMKKIGGGVKKGVVVAGKVAEHPAMVALSVAFPVAWFKIGLTVVRNVNSIANDYKADTGRDMNDEQKRDAFAREFRAEFPDASNGDLATLAGILVKLEKSGESMEVDE